MAAANKELTVHFPVAAEPSKVLKTLHTLEYAEEPIRSAQGNKQPSLTSMLARNRQQLQGLRTLYGRPHP